MRTTIRIDDELYREVKARAARSGRTVAAVLEDAVRRGLAPSERRAGGRYRVRATGKGVCSRSGPLIQRRCRRGDG
jgi:plasmid stability protein